MTVKDCVTGEAALTLPEPVWLASMEQVPALRKFTCPPTVMVHTVVVVLAKLTVKLAELVAVSVGVVPKLCVPGLVKVMV